MEQYQLDQRLKNDTIAVGHLKLCEIRLMNDSRWLWFILVPQRPNISEIYQLNDADKIELMTEISFISGLITEKADKINIGALGNIVNQLHIHIIARNNGDPGWPGPVWGFGDRIPYKEAIPQVILRNYYDHLDTYNCFKMI